VAGKLWQKKCDSKIVVEKSQQKKYDRKIAAEKLGHKKCGRNITAEKSRQQHGWGLFMRDLAHLV
jgi:hypothetical protein